MIVFAPMLIAYGAIALRLMRFLPTMVSPFYIGLGGILFVAPVTIFQNDAYDYLKDFDLESYLYLAFSGFLVAL